MRLPAEAENGIVKSAAFGDASDGKVGVASGTRDVPRTQVRGIREAVKGSFSCDRFPVPLHLTQANIPAVSPPT